jgi:hypothetical protein
MEVNMVDKEEMIKQTRAAFDFIDQLYRETSYLIKEIEGLLRDENEAFIIGRPSGYGISVKSSTGLEPNFVGLWGVKKLAIFFVPKDMTKVEKGQTITPMTKELKVLYFRPILQDAQLKEPHIYYGVIYDVKDKGKGYSKFEKVMGQIEYNDEKVLKDYENIQYEDAYVSFKGNLQRMHLFDLTSSEDIGKKLIQPALKLFRQVQ